MLLTAVAAVHPFHEDDKEDDNDDDDDNDVDGDEDGHDGDTHDYTAQTHEINNRCYFSLG